MLLVTQVDATEALLRDSALQGKTELAGYRNSNIFLV